MRWATWCRLGSVGMPVPMSRYWRMPALPASHRVTRCMNQRLVRATCRAVPSTLMMCRPSSSSTG
ncbi:hypothetical protein SGRIM128S_00187 [Streptomyces griseomycini]